MPEADDCRVQQAGELLSLLDRHAENRRRGIPTVTTLVGHGEAGVSTWNEWSSRHGLSDVLAATSSAKEFTEELVNAVFGSTRPFGEIVRVLAEAASQEPEDLAESIRRKTDADLELFCRHALPDQFELMSERVAELVLSHRGGPVAADDVLGVFSRGAIQPFVLLETLSELLPSDTLPAVVFQAPEDDPAPSIRLAGEIAMTHPGIHVAITLTEESWQTYVAESAESRAKALCRQSIVRVATEGEESETSPGRLSVAGEVEHTRQYLQGLTPSTQDPPLFETLDEAAEEVLRGSVAPKAEDGARSAAERFLFQCLESCEDLRGLFELNGLLPISFGAMENVEVDILCRQKSIAIEIDGYHHFQYPTAYRRDRYKDYLLQRHGYLVLRFLAEDVVTRLEAILEQIREAVGSRK